MNEMPPFPIPCREGFDACCHMHTMLMGPVKKSQIWHSAKQARTKEELRNRVPLIQVASRNPHTDAVRFRRKS
jgi:hypothetical protein